MSETTEKEVTYMAGLPHRGMAITMLTLRQILLNKYLPIAIAFLLIPSAIAVYTIFDTPSEYDGVGMFVNVSLFLFLQFFILFYSLIYGSSLIHDEIEKRTMTYLIVRSSKRFEIVIFKFIGFVISINLLFLGPIFLCYFLFTVQESTDAFVENLDMFVSVCMVVLIASIGYGAFFTFLSTKFKRPLMIGLLYAFIWEVFITNLPMNIRRATLMYYMRSLFFNWVHYGSILELPKMQTVGFSLTFIVITVLLFLGLSCWLMTRKEIH